MLFLAHLRAPSLRHRRHNVALAIDQPQQSLHEAIASVGARIGETGELLDLDRRRAAAGELEAQSASEGFWEDADAAEATLRTLAEHRAVLEQAARWEAAVEDAKAAADLEEAELVEEASAALASLDGELDAWELRSLMGGAHDSCGAVLTLTAGAGGVDAQDWAEMLLRMYRRWAEGHPSGYRVTLTERTEGEEAGIKSAALTIDGPYAYGHLKAERGAAAARGRGRGRGSLRSPWRVTRARRVACRHAPARAALALQRGQQAADQLRGRRADAPPGRGGGGPGGDPARRPGGDDDPSGRRGRPERQQG